MPRSLNSSLMKPLVVLALPGMYLAYKITEYKRQQQEQKRRKVTERELSNLNHKIDKLLTRLEEHEPELASSQDEECVICISAKATMQTYPCGHRVVCRKCFVKTIQMTVSQRLLPLRCVICRTKILRLKQSGPGNNCPAPTPIPPGSLASLPVAALRQAASANGGVPPSLVSLDPNLGASAKCVLHKHNQRRRSLSPDSSSHPDLSLGQPMGQKTALAPLHIEDDASSTNDCSSKNSRSRTGAPFQGKPSTLFTIPEKEEADPLYDPVFLAQAIRLRAESSCGLATAAGTSVSASSDFRWLRPDPWQASPAKLQSKPGSSSSSRPLTQPSSSRLIPEASGGKDLRQITRAEVHLDPDLFKDSPRRNARSGNRAHDTPHRKKAASMEFQLVHEEEICTDISPENSAQQLSYGRSSSLSLSSASTSLSQSSEAVAPAASYGQFERRAYESVAQKPEVSVLQVAKALPAAVSFSPKVVVTAAEIHIDARDISPLVEEVSLSFGGKAAEHPTSLSPLILTPVKADINPNPWASSPLEFSEKCESVQTPLRGSTPSEELALFDPLTEVDTQRQLATIAERPTSMVSTPRLVLSLPSPIYSARSPEGLPTPLNPPPRKSPRSTLPSPDSSPRPIVPEPLNKPTAFQPLKSYVKPYPIFKSFEHHHHYQSTLTSTSSGGGGAQSSTINPFRDDSPIVVQASKKSLPSAAIELLAKPSLWKDAPGSRSRLKMGKSGTGLLGSSKKESKKDRNRTVAPEVQPLVAKMRSAKISPVRMEVRQQPTPADGWKESPVRTGNSLRSAISEAISDPWRGSPSRTKVFPATFEITEMWGESLSKPLLSPHNSPRKQTKMSARAKMATLSPLASLQQLRNRSPLKVLRLKHS